MSHDDGLSVEQDCCSVCNVTRVDPVTPVPRKGIEFYDELDYSKHKCKRECLRGWKPMTCFYKFRIEWYQTMSKACYECPYNATDCSRPHCIAADGVKRSVMVINRMMPGPAIEVCENDIVVGDLENHLMGESTTIHWHGLHMKKTPYGRRSAHFTVSDQSGKHLPVHLQSGQSGNPLLALPYRNATR